MAAGGRPILALHGITKRYGALVVADGLDLALNPGEALGVIGPNGAGKTTMFNIITGTVRADAGRVLFDGADITEAPVETRCRLGIARSFQIPHPFVGMTVFENLLVGATFGAGLGQREGAARCAEILELTGLARRANDPAGALTLLERKRLEMGRALATEPKVLLLDEIAGGLSEPECHELMAAIGAIRRTGVSIVWIEHVVHVLLAVVDRLAVLNFGAKIAEGAPRAVFESREVQDIYMGIEGHV